MRKSRFSDEQIVRILREAEKENISVVSKRHGISDQTIYKWKTKFGQMEIDEVRRQLF